MKSNAPGSVASLVCGILSIVLCFLPLVGLVLGIIAIQQAGKARRFVEYSPDEFVPGGVRVGGFVCGIIGTVFSGIYNAYYLLAVVFFTSVMSAH